MLETNQRLLPGEGLSSRDRLRKAFMQGKLAKVEPHTCMHTMYPSSTQNDKRIHGDLPNPESQRQDEKDPFPGKAKKLMEEVYPQQGTNGPGKEAKNVRQQIGRTLKLSDCAFIIGQGN